MEDQERERNKGLTDEPDVEAHREKPVASDAPDSEAAPARREGEDEEPDVEAHRSKA